MKEPTLLIMAAGMGSRYGGLKQIDTIGSNGEILLDFSLYDAYMAGFKKVVFVIKHEIEADFKEKVEGKADKYFDVQYAYQELDDLPEGYSVPEGRIKPWGTSHAVLAARDLIDGPFAAINSDDYYGPGAFCTIYDFLTSVEDNEKYQFGMVAYQVEKTLSENGSVARGVCAVNEKGYLSQIDERTKIMRTENGIAYTEDEGKTFVNVPEGTPVSMNFWGFTESFMKEIKARFPKFLDKTLKENPLKGEFYVPFAVKELIEEGKAEVKVMKSQDQWYGVTYKEDKEDVVNALQSLRDKGFYPEKLWQSDIKGL